MTRRRAAAVGILFAAAAVSAQPPAAARELHVVALYEGVTRTGNMIHGGKAAVRVDRPGKEVTLVVSSYDPVTWEVTAGPTTKLVKVVVAGYHRQTAKVPERTEVVEAFHDGRAGKTYFYFPYDIKSGRFRTTVKALHTLTGQEVRSFQGTYRFDPARPFVVDAVQDEPRLASDYPKPDPAADLPKVRFSGVLAVPADRFQVSASWGDFTQAGPDRATFKPLPNRLIALAHDPAGKKYYGLTHHEILDVDLEKRTSTMLDPGLAVPRVSWPSAITFDTKRERLVVATRTGGYLYTYTPKTGAWAVIAEHRGRYLAALAYRPDDDTLYALEGPLSSEGGMPSLVRLNAEGAILKTTDLGPPMFPGLVSLGPVWSAVHLGVAGDQLAVVTAVPVDREGRGGKFETFLYLIDPKTDKVRLAWKE
jgi:hypothetical protein